VTDQAPIIDDQVLDDLRASVGGDDAFVAELAATYVSEGAGHISEIEAAAGAADLEAIVRPAHSLKSSSASLGAARLAQISREIEFAGREGRAEPISGLVDSARAAWDETVLELRARKLAP
jgi:HPt (histidine-containing phosphotransfer) domain-containing protein